MGVSSASAKIPCVYVGTAPHRLSADHGPHHDGNGKPLTSMELLPGHTLMMSEEEVNGVTFWHDPRGILPSQKLGTGRVVKAEHQGLDLETLMVLGYDFADGRSDFLTVEQAKQQARPADVAPHVAMPGNAVPVQATVIPLPQPQPSTPASVPVSAPVPAQAKAWNTAPVPSEGEESNKKSEGLQ